MTTKPDNLTAELARLNELDTWVDSYLQEAVALANKLHALLVQVVEVLEIYKHADEVLGGLHNGEAAQMLTIIHNALKGDK